jgi:hypothetical protein
MSGTGVRRGSKAERAPRDRRTKGLQETADRVKDGLGGDPCGETTRAEAPTAALRLAWRDLL